MKNHAMKSRARALALFSAVGLLLGGFTGLSVAASLSGGTLALSPGDSVTATCPNSLGTSGRTTHSIKLSCAPNPTTTTPLPTTTTTPSITSTVPPTTTTPPTTTSTGTWWRPGAGNLEWQWQIDHPMSLTSAADMGTGKTAYTGATAPATNPTVYDIDAIQNPASTVAALNSKGFHTICYIEVGTAGNYYSTTDEGVPTTYFDQLQAAGDLGSKLQGY